MGFKLCGALLNNGQTKEQDYWDFFLRNYNMPTFYRDFIKVFYKKLEEYKLYNKIKVVIFTWKQNNEK